MKTKASLLKELAGFGRKCYEEKLVIAAGGNISARLGSIIFIKKEGASLAGIGTKAFVALSIKGGTESQSRRSRPSSEFRMHLACFKARPDIGAVIHTHPVFSTVLANAKTPLKGFNYEFAAIMNSGLERIDYIKPGTEELAGAVARAVKKANGLLLEKHGIVTVGRDLAEAFNRTLALERAAKIFVLETFLKKKL